MRHTGLAIVGPLPPGKKHPSNAARLQTAASINGNVHKAKGNLNCRGLRIKRFLGTSENAVKTQIWCAVSTYVLIAIVKKDLHLEASLYTLLQILSVSVFEKNQLSCALQPTRSQTDPPLAGNQLNLSTF